MKLSKKITILISVIFIIIFAIIASRYFVGKHFEKKFSQRPPPGVIVEIVDNSEFFEKIETFGTAVALKTKNYRIKKEQIEDQKIKFGKIIKRGEIVVIIDNEKIIAPFKGVLGKREIAQGVLGTDSFILTLDDISSVMLDIKVPESYLSILKAGLDVNIKSDSYQKKFKGIIESVSSRVDPNTRSVLCNIKVSNPNLELIPGMLLNAEIIYNKVQAIGVSESSILVQGKTNFVYKVLEDNSVEKMEVEVGKRSFGKVMVLNGLNINDKIIKEGISKVRNKMKVKIVNQ
ncbi:MAG: efflux RND transporter periplasmic adaptor subunit [Candidatus Pelagibacter sp.]|nr:efflux transporter periplasmic adaptor subunit [Candidatus Pelagibacter sp.]